MATQHSAITNDADLHEPKGAGSALSRQVLVANGLGGTSFTNGLMNTHSQIGINSNTTAKAMTAAADATLNTNTDYTKMTGAAFPWTVAYTDNISFTTDQFTLPYGGYYLVSFWGSFKVAAINTFMGIKYAINNTAPYSVQKLITQSTTANDIKSLSATSIIGPVSANDTLSFYMASTNSTNITMQDGGVMVGYLHA